MSMSTAISSFQGWRDRQQARQGAERLESDDDHPLQTTTSEEEQEQLTLQQLSSNDGPPIVETVPEDEDVDIENQLDQPESPTETTPAVVTIRERSSNRPLSLADLEEERELTRRRTNACVLIAVFILFRLWIQAVATGDFVLLLLCLVGTSWTARFLRHTREREEELDRLVSEYNENDDGNDITRNELVMMSFQAQLAHAILQSQREMMQGGFGHPDGGTGASGVSDDAKSRWDKFDYKPSEKGYGSLTSDVDLEKSKGSDDGSVEEPHCSICLGEYEEGETLVCLPCKHVYHENCVGSWCSNHIRCPLCNFDLESVRSESPSEEA